MLKKIFCLVIFLGLSVGAAFARQVPPEFRGRNDAVFSPHGYVPEDSFAISPNNKYLARLGQDGAIEVFVRGRKSPFKRFMLDPGNVCKGYAWAGNSRLLAVQYHRGSGTIVHTVDIVLGKVVARNRLPSFHHYMVFSRSGKLVLLPKTSNSPIVVKLNFIK